MVYCRRVFSFQSCLMEVISKTLIFLLSLSQSFVRCAVLYPKDDPVPDERWMRPCRGSIISDQTLIPDLIDIRTDGEDHVSHHLWIKAHTVVDAASLLKDIYVRDRIQSNHLRVYLDDNTTVPGFPDYRVFTATTPFADRIYHDYRRAAVAAVFVQQMRDDEDNVHFSPSLSPQIRTLESKLYPFLCMLKRTLSMRTSYSIPDITRDVMGTSLRNPSTTAERYRRDYRILRDITLLFYSIQSDYDVNFGRRTS